MLAHVQSFILQGIDATPCEIEFDIQDGLSKEVVVGLPNAAVKESLERVRSAVGSAGYRFPTTRLVVNLAPADVRKEGPAYDLPIAIGLLIADGTIIPASVRRASRRTTSSASGARTAVLERPAPALISAYEGLDLSQWLFAGELSLDGRVRPIRGALAMASFARQRGLRGVVVPAENAVEAAVVDGIEVIAVRDLGEVVGLLNGQVEPCPQAPVDVASLIQQAHAEVDFAEVRGQEAVKRAIVVAAAGSHNILMLGPAGTGKTMMAKALAGILPPMSIEEALEVSRVYSAAGSAEANAAGAGGNSGLVMRRPVRTPHHTASSAAIIGGGAIPRPGDVSLAHHGVLFLDEMAEFPRSVLDTLRQPLEDGRVTISRAHSALTFPASFMLVAAMNPTAKGDMPTNEQGRREMDRYMSRLSRPLIDRIDIHVEAPAVPFSQLAGKSARVGTSSAQMRERVMRARKVQHARQGAACNARLKGKQLDTLAPMSDEARELLGQAITGLGLSARAYDKVRRVARTIADLDEKEGIDVAHVSEAVQYRLLDRSTA